MSVNARQHTNLRIVWIVPGFSADENDWCIPALHYPFRRDVYHAFGATVHSLGGANRGGAHTPNLWREAIKTITALQPDALHAFWAYEPGIIAAWLARRVPTIIHLAGGELIDLPDIGYGLRGKAHVRGLMRWALNQARIVTAGSHYLMNIAEKFAGGREIVFAPLGVPHLPPPSPKGEGELVILNVGSLEPVKDQALLLRTFKRVHDVVPEARLIIAGQGRLESELRTLNQDLGLSNHVEFTGQIAHDQLNALYRQAALYVQTSRHEAQGMAVLEAAMWGVPVVGTAVGALADLSPDSAIATPVGDEASLAQAIINLLRDPLRRRQLGKAAQAIVAREYALTRAVDQAMMMYEVLMSDA